MLLFLQYFFIGFSPSKTVDTCTRNAYITYMGSACRGVQNGNCAMLKFLDTPEEFNITPAGWTRAALAKIQYTGEQQALIDAEAARTASGHVDGADYMRSETLIQRGSDVFAVFGNCARLVKNDAAIEDAKGRARFEYLPALVGGQCIEQSPDEGASGMLMLMRKTKHCGQPYAGEWMAVYMSTAWIRTTEIMLPNSEIAERIAAS